jgi:hypothetical protein
MESSDPKPRLDADLARRLHRALTAHGEELLQTVEETALEVLRALLKNPQLTEKHLLALLKRRDLTEEYLRAVYHMPLVESSHILKIALVRNPHTPAPVVLTLLPHLHLFELADICCLPGVTVDQKVAAERAIIQRLPTTLLGNKITLARRATTAVVDALLQEGDLHLMEPCLTNPHLKEAAVFRFLTGPRTTAETISFVARHPKWKTRPNLRLAILKNQNTPLVWYPLFLPGIPTVELRNLLASKRLGPAQRQAVREEGKRRGLG